MTDTPPPPPPTSADGGDDELPGWSPEERDQYLQSLGDHILFSEPGEELPGDDQLMEAMLALREEGETPETLAEHFKQQGNENFRSAKGNRVYLQNAMTAYAEALGYAQKAEQTEEIVRLQSVVWSNLAAVNLTLRNYGKVKRECDCALELWAGNVKALFRSAKARAALHQHADGVAFAERGLALEPDNEPLQKILAKSGAVVARQRAEAEARAAAEAEKRAAVETLRAACAQRGVQMGPAILNMAQYPGWPAEAEDGVFLWPVVFLYPEHSQSDFVQAFPENGSFGEQLDLMFPAEGPFPDWDAKRAYKSPRLEVWFEVSQVTPFGGGADEWMVLQDENRGHSLRNNRIADEDKRWVRVPRRTPLAAVLARPEYVVPLYPVFHVFVRGSKFHSQMMRTVAGRVSNF